MIRYVFAIRDLKAEVFMPGTFTALTQGEAERTFVELCSQEGTTMGKYPADFALYAVGSWDDHAGRLLPLEIEGSVVPPRLAFSGEQVLELRRVGLTLRKEA